MNTLLEQALAALDRLGWQVVRAPERRKLPAAIATRYPDIPPPALEFIENVEACVRGDETVWFLTAADYAGVAKDSAHPWDEWERMGLEAAREDGDEAYEKEVRAFWDGHLPILFAVTGDLQFMAICVDKDSKKFGAVVEAEALAFEDASVWAASYERLLKDIVACANDPAYDGIVGLHMLTPEQHGERQAARKGKSLLGKLFGRG
jgi:hypothetical protein